MRSEAFKIRFGAFFLAVGEKLKCVVLLPEKWAGQYAGEKSARA
jgi:hypothetical protein